MASCSIIHASIGKTSFDKTKLEENASTFIRAVQRAKPAAAKGRYIRAITLTSTMGPGIHVDPGKTRGIVEELEEQAEPVSV